MKNKVMKKKVMKKKIENHQKNYVWCVEKIILFIKKGSFAILVKNRRDFVNFQISNSNLKFEF